MPTWLVKESLPLLSTFITAIVNASITQNCFPRMWKHAIVTPLPKMANADAFDPKHFRPVCGLPFLSKVLERIVLSQLTSYLNTNSLLPHYQSAYRKGHSTETALLKVFTDVIDATDSGDIALLSLLDMSAVFDTVDHLILLERLSRSFGFSDQTIDWIKSYLGGRSQSVHVSGDSSNSRSVTSGVPQGSVLGPIAFVLYTSDLEAIAQKHGSSCHCYADDSQLYMRGCMDDYVRLGDGTISCMCEIEAWMRSNRLQLNPAKTQFIWHIYVASFSVLTHT